MHSPFVRASFSPGAARHRPGGRTHPNHRVVCQATGKQKCLCMRCERISRRNAATMVGLSYPGTLFACWSPGKAALGEIPRTLFQRLTDTLAFAV